MQKKAVRIISSSSFRAHTPPLFNSLGILQVKKLYINSIIVFMYKYFNDMLPKLDVFSTMFQVNYNIHSHNTRQSCKLHVPVSKRTYSYHTIRFMGIHLWNKIISIIQPNISFYLFKAKLRKYLLDNDLSYDI